LKDISVVVYIGLNYNFSLLSIIWAGVDEAVHENSFYYVHVRTKKNDVKHVFIANCGQIQ